MQFSPRLVLLCSIALAACGPQGPDCGTGEELCLIVEESAAAYLSVRAPASDDVWIVGTEADPGVSGPSALHWDGEEWTSPDLSAFAGYELWWSHPGSERVVFVGSSGLILEHDRSSGESTKVDGVPENITFFGVWGASADDLWAVGGVIGGAEMPALWRRDASGWSAWDTDVNQVPGRVWFKVHGNSSSDLWIVGSDGVTAYWDGESLTEHSAASLTSGGSLFTVAVEEDRAVAVGGSAGGVILEWDESAWVDLAPEFAPAINGVCIGAGVEHAVGAQGAVYTADADEWTADLVGVTLRDYHACDISPDGAMWAVGGQIVSRPLNAGVIAYRGGVTVPAP